MKKRVISAIIALAISIPIVYFGGALFKIFVIILASLGIREYLNLEKTNDGVKLITFISFISILFCNLNNNNFSEIINTNTLMIIMLLYATTSLLFHKTIKTDDMFKLLGTTLFLGIGFSLFLVVRNISLEYFIYLFSVSIFTDTFAHAVGTITGKHKVNEISPNKSWEGYIGGSLLGTILSAVTYMLIVDPYVALGKLVLLSFSLSIVAHLGDLFFSQIKRNHNKKDFSNIMPGHGGILDRFDSIIFVMMAFSFLINIL